MADSGRTNSESLQKSDTSSYGKGNIMDEFQKVRDDTYVERSKMNEVIIQKNAEIEELRSELATANREIEKLRRDISEKYQSYIDNYDAIGGLVYESKIRSDKMINDAELQRGELLAKADAEVKKKIDAVQSEIDKRIEDGEQRYREVEEELKGMVDLVNQVQKNFMESYKSIHTIVDQQPAISQDYDDDEDDEEEDLE